MQVLRFSTLHMTCAPIHENIQNGISKAYTFALDLFSNIGPMLSFVSSRPSGIIVPITFCVSTVPLLPVSVVLKVALIGVCILIVPVAYTLGKRVAEKENEQKRATLMSAYADYKAGIMDSAKEIHVFRNTLKDVNIKFKELNKGIKDTFTLLHRSHRIVKSIIQSYGLPCRSSAAVPEITAYAFSDAVGDELRKLWNSIEYDFYHYPKLPEKQVALTEIQQMDRTRKEHHEKVKEKLATYIDFANTIIAERWNCINTMRF